MKSVKSYFINSCCVDVFFFNQTFTRSRHIAMETEMRPPLMFLLDVFIFIFEHSK